jgi:hypothetical protein
MDPNTPFVGHSAEEVLDAWDAVRPSLAPSVARQGGQARAGWRVPPRTIDAQPVGFWAAYRARWRTAPLHICMIAIFLGGFVLPWTILIGGIVLLAVWTAITGH